MRRRDPRALVADGGSLWVEAEVRRQRIVLAGLWRDSGGCSGLVVGYAAWERLRHYAEIPRRLVVAASERGRCGRGRHGS